MYCPQPLYTYTCTAQSLYTYTCTAQRLYTHTCTVHRHTHTPVHLYCPYCLRTPVLPSPCILTPVLPTVPVYVHLYCPVFVYLYLYCLQSLPVHCIILTPDQHSDRPMLVSAFHLTAVQPRVTAADRLDVVN